ncbi:WcaI family glycosyltransferase [Qipengyuania soli]|uniref:WcaI family glycosyltransferase n=1 Tax=Qipengyuania soli TaxID=2782568 RepID=UPI001FE4D7BD|nr:WcaI family glycosyltransferase [Qipengyuania soli]
MTRLLFLGLNFAPEEIGVGHYSTQLVEHWLGHGHEATIVAAKPYYPQWHTWPGYKAGWQSGAHGAARICRCPIYVPSKPTGFRRIVHYATFGLSAFFPAITAAIRTRPDIVMTVAPSLLAAPIALVAAKVCGARSWLHVQDFEVQAAFATGLLGDSGFIARLAKRFERWTFGKFDTVSTISSQMCKRLAQNDVQQDRIVEMRNWADLDQISPLSAPSSYRERWAVKTPHVALYSGNIANKQGLDLIIDAARILKDRKDLTFVICGNGSDRSALEERSGSLPNVQFHDLQPRAELGELLGLATIHLLPHLERAADLMLPSKLANMLASGRPVVATAVEGTGLSQEVEGVGLVTPPRDADAFASAIVTLMEDPALHSRFSAAARLRAETRWNKQEILAPFMEAAGVPRLAKR